MSMWPLKLSKKVEIFSLLLIAVGILSCALWVFLPTLPYPFQFDDYSNVIFNRGIRHLRNPAVFWENITLRNRPLTALTYAFNYHWSGLSLSVFRFWNISLHFLNAGLLGILFFKLFSTQGKLVKGRSGIFGSILVAGIFLLHPLATDTTIYITGRASLLALFFPLLALLIYFSSFPIWIRVPAFWGLMLLGVLSKESAVVFFLMVVIFHLWMRRNLFELFGFLFPLLPGALYFWKTKANYLEGAWSGYFFLQGDLSVRTFWEHLQVSVSLWPKILALFFAPSLQSVDHDLNWEYVNSYWMVGVFLWAIFFSILFINFKRPRAWQLPILWLFVSLLITNSIFPTLDPLSERHFYVAIPWIAMAFVLWIPQKPKGLAVVGIAVLFFLAFSAKKRAADWESPLKLWTSAYKLYPEKFRVRFNLSRAIRRETGDIAESFRMHWGYLGTQGFLATTYHRQMDLMRFLMSQWEAISREERLKLEVNNVWQEIIVNGAALSRARGIPTGWIEWKRKKLKAGDERVMAIISILEAKKLAQLPGQERTALEVLSVVIEQQKKDHHPYWIEEEMLGNLYLSLGRKEEALRHLVRAARIYKVFKRFPRELHFKIYDLFWERGDWARASDAMGELVRVFSDDTEVRELYWKALEKAGHANALSQAKHLSFYRGNPLSKEKEIIRP